MSGLHGTGKTTYARLLAEDFGLRHISAGELFRRIAKEKEMSLAEFSKLASKDPLVDKIIDDQTKKEAKEGNVVIDGLLASWVAGDLADIKVHLVAPEKIRITRIAKRDGIPYREAMKITLLRERIEKERFKRVYSIDIDDKSIYDLVLNTGQLSLEANVEIIKKYIQEYLISHGGK
ncbi:MAG: CMP/dCMP kinase [Thermoproteota archaeon]|nr:CMP/dCMP kinase [Thermoproteota archaeon]